MLFEKILLPVDGSERSVYAVEQAIKIAKDGGEIFIISVMPPIPYVIGGEALKEAEGEAAKDAHMITNKIEELMKSLEIKYTVEILFDNSPSRAIVAACEKYKCDLVVMASRGRNDLEGLLLGSVTHRVITLAKVPVLVINVD